MANDAETATLYELNDTKANNFQLDTKWDGGPVTGDVGLAFAKATGDYAADQADVEHGAYGAFGSAAPSIQAGAPGCNNGANNCTNGNHGYAWLWNNGGTSGLPSASYPNNYGYSSVLSNPAYTLFKSNWAWANTLDEKQWAVKFDLHFKANDVIDVTAGARYQDRDIDYVHGRYLENGAGTAGLGGIGAGTPAGNCCTSAASGTWLYYQDPGYARIPYSTPQTNPNLLLTYNNFANGPIAVKNPVAGGMTDPATYLNTVWSQAGNSEQLRNVLQGCSEFLHRDRKDHVGIRHGRRRRREWTVPCELRHAHRPDPTHGRRRRNQSDRLDVRGYRIVERRQCERCAVRKQPQLHRHPAVVQLRVECHRYPETALRRGPRDVAAEPPASSAPVCSTASRAPPPPVVREVAFASSSTAAPRAIRGSIRSALRNSTSLGRTTSRAADWSASGTSTRPSTISSRPRTFPFAYPTAPRPAARRPTFPRRSTAAPARSTASSSAPSTRSTSASASRRTTRARIPPRRKAARSATICRFRAYPGTAVNAIVYYEHYGFSARAAYEWRDTAVNSSGVGSSFAFQDINGNSKIYTVYSAPYGQLDAQVGYDFNRHFGLLLQVVNLTDAKQHTYLQFPNEPFTYDDTGTRFYFGVKGKL